MEMELTSFGVRSHPPTDPINRFSLFTLSLKGNDYHISSNMEKIYAEVRRCLVYLRHRALTTSYYSLDLQDVSKLIKPGFF